MNTQEKEQFLPYSCDKKKLMAMYMASNVKERDIRLGINAIIEENRKGLPNQSKNVKNLWHAELMEFVEIFGLPKGYKLPEK